MRIYEPGWPRNEVEAATAREIVRRVRPYTMVLEAALEVTLRAVTHVHEERVRGDFVECGVWQGGCAAAMRLADMALGTPSPRRDLHLFDSFEGLPAAQAVDGPLAATWQADTSSPGYYDNCRASVDVVEANLVGLGVLEADVHIHAGWFERTVPEFARSTPMPSIAVLRLDGDWYESTKVCLDHLYPLVSENGVVILDDYYAWDGCALALHEYFGVHRLSHRIRSVEGFAGAYFVKQAHRDDWRI